MTETQSNILNQFKTLSPAEAAETLSACRTSHREPTKGPNKTSIVGFSIGDSVQIVSGRFTKKYEGKNLKVAKVAKSHLWLEPLTPEDGTIWPHAVDCKLIDATA